MNTSITQNQHIPLLLLSLFALLAFASPPAMADSKTSRISQIATTNLKSNSTRVELMPPNTFVMAAPGSYVYGLSDDFKGVLPLTAVPQRQVVDLVVRGASEMLINGSLKMQAPNCH